MTDLLSQRAAAAQAHPTAPPSGAARCQPFRSTLRAQKASKDGQDFDQLDGYASVTETPYEMWDMFGPYTETVSAGAFDVTLRAEPDVAFLVNHKGVTMARSTNGSLVLEADQTGLHSLAWLNPKRQDVRDLVIAVEDGHITEMSFAFTITRGSWSPDYTEYRIEEVDLNRGDVSAVNYGANPYTSIAMRSRDLLELVEHLDGPVLAAAQARLAARLGSVEPERGKGVALLRRQMDLETA